ncbi:hypothetical protein [Cylindrospermum sp. FACHB-282]|nr:hypothetical protein [Cylindrospermum sp. FACHB-282]
MKNQRKNRCGVYACVDSESDAQALSVVNNITISITSFSSITGNFLCS